jgi:hypothetical protein
MAGERHVMCETALKRVRGWQASADEDTLTYDAFKNRKLEICIMMFRICTLHQIIYGSNQGEWDVSEMRCVWEIWEKHTEF